MILHTTELYPHCIHNTIIAGIIAVDDMADFHCLPSMAQLKSGVVLMV
jgi:hypothetical protein